MLLDQTATFSNWKGALQVYCQFEVATLTHKELSITNPFETGIPTGYDMRDRIIMISIWLENNANELPKQGSYDPNTAFLGPIQKLWHTGDGAPKGAAPASGVYWKVGAASLWLYTWNNDATKFIASNGAGASYFVSMSMIIWQSD
jgi:hypothetical protein